jgi:hypothetical protein
MDMRLDTLNVRSLYRSGSLTTVAREFAILKKQDEGKGVNWFHLVQDRQVGGYCKGSNEPADSMERGIS